MSCTKIDPALHQARKPDWIKVRLPNNPVFFSTKALVADLKLNTVCESAQVRLMGLELEERCVVRD